MGNFSERFNLERGNDGSSLGLLRKDKKQRQRFRHNQLPLDITRYIAGMWPSDDTRYLILHLGNKQIVTAAKVLFFFKLQTS